MQVYRDGTWTTTCFWMWDECVGHCTKHRSSAKIGTALGQEALTLIECGLLSPNNSYCGAHGDLDSLRCSELREGIGIIPGTMPEMDESIFLRHNCSNGLVCLQALGGRSRICERRTGRAPGCG